MEVSSKYGRRFSTAERNAANLGDARGDPAPTLEGKFHPIVAPDRGSHGKFLLLDGHLRIEVLKDIGETHVVCLRSIDHEAFTYNKRVSRLAIVQEHKMMLKAIERGVPEARLAKALNIDVSLRQKKRLLDGICSEAAEVLKDKFVPVATFDVLNG